MSNVFEPVPTGTYLPETSEIWFDGARTRVFTYPRMDRSPGGPEEESPVVVMVHGFRGDHHGLQLMALALRQRCEVVVPDLPGYGVSEPLQTLPHTADSYAQWLETLLEGYRGRPVVLLGHSFGSVVAARAARGRDLLALALVNPICEPPLESSARLPSLAASWFYRASQGLPRRLGDRLVRSALVTRISSELMMKTPDRSLRRWINGQHEAYFGAFASRTVVLESYDSSIRDTVREAAPEVSSPTLLVAAERDDLGSLQGQQELAGLFPHARLQVIPEVGHLIHYETPRRAALLVQEFVEELLAEGGRP